MSSKWDKIHEWIGERSGRIFRIRKVKSEMRTSFMEWELTARKPFEVSNSTLLNRLHLYFETLTMAKSWGEYYDQQIAWDDHFRIVQREVKLGLAPTDDYGTCMFCHKNDEYLALCDRTYRPICSDRSMTNYFYCCGQCRLNFWERDHKLRRHDRSVALVAI